MSRDRTHRLAAPVRLGADLPAAYWTRLEHVRVPGGEDVIDLVLVGPSGVHVVADRPGQPSGALPADDHLQQAAGRAAEAAVAVAGLLPERYRGVVTSAVCLRDGAEVGVSVGVVLAASPDVLRHTWQHRPRVLSTSEASTVARLLGARLEKCALDAAPPVPWWRRRARGRWLLGCTVSAAGVAAAGAAVLEPSLLR